MTQTVRIVDPWTYIHAIYGGVVPSLDAVPDVELLDATRLDHLQLAFMFPEWPQDKWQGLRKRGAPKRFETMTRVGEHGRMDSDGVEYESDPPMIVEGKDGRMHIQTQPWRRTSDKRETSSQLRKMKREGTIVE